GVALFRNPQGRNWWTEFELPPPPGKGDCMFPDPKCKGPDCPQEAGAPPLAPHFSLWIDRNRIDDCADHLDEYPDASRIRRLSLSPARAPGRRLPPRRGRARPPLRQRRPRRALPPRRPCPRRLRRRAFREGPK